MRSSGRETILPIGLMVALALVMVPTGARAQVLALFQYEDQARAYCPADTVVWLDFEKRKYYASGQRLYGSGFHGSFVCRQEARRNRYRRSPLGRR